MNTKSKVETATDFKTMVVDPDYHDYKSDPHNLRHAYHLAVSLFHLRDWTYLEYSNAGPWPYSPNLGSYQADLERICSEFGYMRDLANAVKHGELDPSKRPSTQMVGLANTAISQVAFQPGAFQPDAFQTRTYIVSKTGPNQYIDFERAADAVIAMWNNIFVKNGR